MKKFYFLSILMLITVILPQNLKAQVSVWDGTAAIWTQGSGTAMDPYLIESAQNLAYIAEMVNAGVTTYSGVCFKLTTDLDMNNIAWEPIGNSETNCFCGKFDGDNHFIDSISISGNYNYKGLFGITGDGFLCKNLGVNTNVTSTGYCSGGLVGLINGANSVIQYCYNTGILDGQYVGGIVGYNNASGVQITSCYNTAILSSNNTTTEVGVEIFSHAGGIIGYNNNIAYIKNCYNTGEISSSSQSSNTNTHSFSGGIVGYNQDCVTYIYNCYNIGTISSASRYSHSGGIVGYNSNTSINIYNCYNTGNIFSYSNSQASYSGGIIGFTYNSSIKNSYNTGTLTGRYRAGIQRTTIGITNCYYLETCSSSEGGGISKTEAQMKSPSFPVILNSDSVVYIMDNININQGYPIFANEIYVLTENANNITFNSATLNGLYSGNADIKGFRYKAETDSVYQTVYCSLNEPYSYSLSGLTAGTNYQYYYFVQKNGATYYGNVKTFSTITCDVSLNITMPTEAVCTGDSVILIASAESVHTSQFSFLWSTGESGNSIFPDSNGLYTVTATADNGCSQTTSYSLSLYPSPAGTISGDTVLCEGGNTVLSASGAWSYQWSTGTHGNTITVAAPGVYSCTFTNEYGCVSESSVTVSTISDITISGNPYICEGGTTQLSAPIADSCLWSTGAQNFSILVNTLGTYSVTIYHGQCSVSASTVVTTIANPTPTITGNTSICEGQSTTLTANGGSSFVWSNASTQNNITVSQSGIYTVTATNAEGCTASTSTTVIVNPLPNVSITGDNSFCQGSSTTLTANGANSYVWNNNSTDASLTVSSAGTYTVTGTDNNGCSNTASKTVSLNPTYTIPLTHSICEGENYNFYGQTLTTAGTYTHTLQTIDGCDSILSLTLSIKALPTTSITGNTTLCEGESTTLTATGGNSYLWSNGSTNNNISISQSGIYSVIATNLEGCSASANVTVSVNPLPNVSINGNTTLCQGSNTTLTANGADSYSWSTGENTASINVSAFGIYTVTGTSAAGCSNTATATVIISQAPVITITGNTELCEGETTTLTATGGSSYLWSNGTTDANLSVNIAGTYQVIGYNDAGCNTMAETSVHVWQPATSEFTITTTEDCYEWNGQSYCQSGDYTQTLQTVHGCDSVVTLHLTITVGIDDYNLAISMTLYPNPTSDLVNVQLTMNNEQLEEIGIQVFDVYGRLLEVVNMADARGTSLQTTQIDLSRYAQGVYFVKAVSEEKVIAVRKVVKR